MNTTSKRCVAIAGYYDNGLNQPIASICNTICLTCVNTSTKCTSCKPGFYLSSFTCLACADVKCNNCTTGTSCLGCIVPYSPSGNTCILNCSLAVTNCSTCTPSGGSVTCDTCVLGLLLDSGANTCTEVCGDGLLGPS
jgi:hypothetical protein